jgi:F-type H+-transporting ATPase subunit alpha
MSDQNLYSDEYGVVEAVHFPLVHVSGLPHVRVGQLIEFKNGLKAQVISFTEETAKAMLLDSQELGVGSKCFHCQAELSIDCAEDLFGTVVNPLGELLYPQIKKTQRGVEQRSIDHTPPKLSARKEIIEPLLTGVSVVDLMLPLGKGQRQLIVGDRGSGKTSFLLNVAQKQISEGAVVVFCLIGKRISEVKRITQLVTGDQFKDNAVLVSTDAQDPPSLISLTPFSAMAVAEYFADQGRDVVLLLDDLTTHARFYREVSLLAKKFPGRDSYPGDIFYTHARLLERAGNFKNGSITCLPLAETTGNDLTNFIVSNLISITDGHLLFDLQKVHRGLHPAINTFLSVTRVGKQTQTALVREVNRELNSLMNRFEKTRSLAHFGAELTAETKKLLSKGNLIEEFFTQAVHSVVPLPVQLAMITMIKLGWLKDLETEQLRNCRNKLIETYHENKELKKIFDELAESLEWEEYKQSLKQVKEKLPCAL